MNRRPTKFRNHFKVLCIWCGQKIRDDNHEESSGVCLKCFYRIVNDHLSRQKHSIQGEFASER